MEKVATTLVGLMTLSLVLAANPVTGGSGENLSKHHPLKNGSSDPKVVMDQGQGGQDPDQSQQMEVEAEDDFAQKVEKVVSIVVPIFFSIVVFVGLFGNLLVVLVVTFNKQMRNTTNLLIMNLAVADILFIVFCVPLSAVAYVLPHNWVFGDIM